MWHGAPLKPPRSNRRALDLRCRRPALGPRWPLENAAVVAGEARGRPTPRALQRHCRTFGSTTRLDPPVAPPRIYLNAALGLCRRSHAGGSQNEPGTLNRRKLHNRPGGGPPLMMTSSHKSGLCTWLGPSQRALKVRAGRIIAACGHHPTGAGNKGHRLGPRCVPPRQDRACVGASSRSHSRAPRFQEAAIQQWAPDRGPKRRPDAGEPPLGPRHRAPPRPAAPFAPLTSPSRGALGARHAAPFAPLTRL